MMEPIRDCKDHIVCYADAATGMLESRYKKQMTRTCVPIGGVFTIVRDETETNIIRMSDREFSVSSIPIAI